MRIKKQLRKIREFFIAIEFMKNAEGDRTSIVFRKGAVCQNTGGKENVKLGKHCTVGAHIQALYGGKVLIGDNVYIGVNTLLQAKESIVIKNNVKIANNVLIVDNNNHPVEPAARLMMSACDDYMTDELWSWKYAESKPILVDENVWICRDARILKGVTIGRDSIVALGAVVTHDVPPYSIVAGNPAKVVKSLESAEGSYAETNGKSGSK